MYWVQYLPYLALHLWRISCCGGKEEEGSERSGVPFDFPAQMPSAVLPPPYVWRERLTAYSCEGAQNVYLRSELMSIIAFQDPGGQVQTYLASSRKTRPPRRMDM